MKPAVEVRKPLPKVGQTIVTKLPYFEEKPNEYLLGRMARYIREGSCHSLVRGQAMGLRNVDEKNPGLQTLKLIHAWGINRFTYMDDPVNQQVIETPMRMIRRIHAMEEAAEKAMSPFRKGDSRPAIAVPGKIGGTSACATILLLSVARAAGFKDLRIRLGGSDGTLHYAWGQVKVKSQWHEVDILNAEFGKLLPFQHYEAMAIRKK